MVGIDQGGLQQDSLLSLGCGELQFQFVGQGLRRLNLE